MKIKQREPEIYVKVCVTVLITAKMLICPSHRGHWVNSRLEGLITNYRGGGCTTKREGGGVCEGLPLRKGGGAQTSFSHADGGPQKVWGSFYVVA